MTVAGNPAYAVGLNIEGMKRRNYDSKTRAAIKEAHKIVYRKVWKLHSLLYAYPAMEARKELKQQQTLVKLPLIYQGLLLKLRKMGENTILEQYEVVFVKGSLEYSYLGDLRNLEQKTLKQHRLLEIPLTQNNL